MLMSMNDMTAPRTFRPAAFGSDRAAVSAGAAVSLDALRKHYGEVRAVDGVDLVIAPGEVVALLGPNGAGKSTTVDMLLGLSKPDGGQARIFGQQPREAVSTGTVGAMLQEGSLLDDATVGETVAMIASLHRKPLPVADALQRAGSPIWRPAGAPSCRVGRSSGCGSLSPWCATPTCWCSTSPPPRWMWVPDAISGSP
jgi:ABC-type transport system involved in cytochrome bd biosynthesis fused ATPase/permease subunit